MDPVRMDSQKRFFELCENSGSEDSARELLYLLNDENLELEVNCKDCIGQTPLILISKECHSQYLRPIVERVLERGANVDATGLWGQNCLHMLCMNYSGPVLESLLELLLSKGLDINAKDQDDQNCLHLLCAVYSGPDLESVVDLLISRGIEIDAKDNDGSNCLHLLCANYRGPDLKSIVDLLISKNIEIDAKGNDGRNCLHLLCANYSGPGVESLVELLLSKGMDINAKDKYGRNCLHLLCMNYSGPGVESLVELLLSKGIDINAKDNHGQNCLHLLCAEYSGPDLESVVDLLISRGIQINAKDNDGWNCLYSLCANYRGPDLKSIVDLLISKNIEIDAKDNDGWNCLHLLCAEYSGPNLESVVDLLLSKSIEINAKDLKGRNCLHLLCANYRGPNLESVVDLLISKGIEINAKDYNGRNCLHLLCKNYSGPDVKSTVDLLILQGIDINAPDVLGGNCLRFLDRFYGGRRENLKRLVEIIREKNIDVSTTDESGQNLLLSLCREYEPRLLKSALQLVDAREIKIDDSFREEIEAEIAEEDSGSDSCSSSDEDQETNESEPSTNTNAEVTDAAPNEEDVQLLTADVATSSSRGKEISQDTPGKGTKRKQSDNDAENDGANGPPGSKKSASGSQELPLWMTLGLERDLVLLLYHKYPDEVLSNCIVNLAFLLPRGLPHGKDVPEASVSACPPCVPGDTCSAESTTRTAVVAQTATVGHDPEPVSLETMIREIYRRVIDSDTSKQSEMIDNQKTIEGKLDELARQVASLQTQMAAVSAPTQYSTTMAPDQPVFWYPVNSFAQAEQVHDLPSGSVMYSEQHVAPVEKASGRENEEVDDRRGNPSEPQSTVGEEFVHDPVKFQEVVSQARAVLAAEESNTLKDFVFRIMDSYFTKEYMRTHSCTQETKRDGSQKRTPMDARAREAIYDAVRQHPAFQSTQEDRIHKDVNAAIRLKLNNYRPKKTKRTRELSR